MKYFFSMAIYDETKKDGFTELTENFHHEDNSSAEQYVLNKYKKEFTECCGATLLDSNNNEVAAWLDLPCN